MIQISQRLCLHRFAKKIGRRDKNYQHRVPLNQTIKTMARGKIGQIHTVKPATCYKMGAICCKRENGENEGENVEEFFNWKEKSKF